MLPLKLCVHARLVVAQLPAPNRRSNVLRMLLASAVAVVVVVAIMVVVVAICNWLLIFAFTTSVGQNIHQLSNVTFNHSHVAQQDSKFQRVGLRFRGLSLLIIVCCNLFVLVYKQENKMGFSGLIGFALELTSVVLKTSKIPIDNLHCCWLRFGRLNRPIGERPRVQATNNWPNYHSLALESFGSISLLGR